MMVLAQVVRSALFGVTHHECCIRAAVKLGPRGSGVKSSYSFQSPRLESSWSPLDHSVPSPWSPYARSTSPPPLSLPVLSPRVLFYKGLKMLFGSVEAPCVSGTEYPHATRPHLHLMHVINSHSERLYCLLGSQFPEDFLHPSWHI